MTALLVFAALIVVYGLISRYLRDTALTSPMVLVACGLVLSPEALDVVSIDLEAGVVEVIAELALAIVLFTDAGRIDFAAVRQSPQIPIRLLALAMPLTMALGAAVAGVVLVDLEFWEAAILATILAPTDAALAQPVITDKRVPARVREGINVESGLNDGLVVPFLFMFVALAGVEEETGSPGFWTRFAIEQIGYGALAGLVVGVVGAWLLVRSLKRSLITPAFMALVPLGLAAIALFGAEHVDGNGFIAAFVAGLVGGRICPDLGTRLLEFTEDEGKLLTLGVFFIFGVAFAAPRLGELTWEIVAYAVLSLTVIRMLPVGLSLLGMGLSHTTKLFVGWFGPRGLASIVLALIVLEEEGVLGREDVVTVAVVTVLLSIFAHGLTARPLASAFGRYAAREEMKGAPEMEEVAPIPVRYPGPRAEGGEMAEREAEEAVLRYLVEVKGIPWVMAREMLLEAIMDRANADADVQRRNGPEDRR